ncbi:ATP-binding protein [Dactylosporangium roseum]|uniref:ATP-binding protein n=1 Tax=Dactylosporangium roseum TaxID=47989 RepID=A0ABY5YUS9_9ACTN|nr:ATP-binding protein [Dactylosporangium roseum]UWZ33501.1 ATP-binding protein [Dactylosporangium roseum]
MPEQHPVDPAARAHGADTTSYTAPTHLTVVRTFVCARAVALGLPPLRAELLVLAVNELATNTLQYTSGGGTVRLWAEADRLYCEVLDSGPVRTFGRDMPPADAAGGRGLAIVERVCDEVTAFAAPGGTVVRMCLDL